MKKNRSLYLVLMALIICLCLSFTACGKSSSDDDDDDIVYDNGDDNYREDNNSDNGNNSGNYSDGDQGNYSDNNGQGDNYDPYFVGGYDVTIYHAGDDTIAVEMAGDSIYNNDDGYYFLEIDDTNGEMLGGISLNSYYSYVGRSLVERDGDHTTISLQEIEGLGGNEGTSTIFGEHKMLITMSKPGAWNEIPDFSNGVYDLRRDADILARGKVSDILKTVTDSEFSAKLSELQMTRQGQNPVKADWAGKYISGYNSPASYLEVEVSKTDMIHFHLVMKDAEYDWFAEESYFDKTEYDDTKYISASCSVYDQHGSSEASMSFNSNDRYPNRASIEVTIYTGDYTRIYFDRFGGVWHAAPADFEDRDVKGLMSDSVFDDDCFKPATDDYMLQVWGGTAMSGLYTGSDEYECENRYALYSYDENRYAIQYVEKYILKSESDAQAAYSKIMAEMSDYTRSIYTYVQKGRNIYLIHNIKNSYSYAKIGQLDAVYGDDWYLNCHYIYTGDDNEAYYTYLYLSKPFTEEEYSLSLEQMLYWKAMDWILPCIDDPNYSLRVEVNELRTRFEPERESYNDGDAPQMSTFDDRYLRFHGATAEGIRIYYSEYEFTGTVYVREYAFGPEEITVTEYQYNFTDPDSLDITLDNYKTKTADAVITHTFAVKEKEVSQW